MFGLFIVLGIIVSCFCFGGCEFCLVFVVGGECLALVRLNCVGLS